MPVTNVESCRSNETIYSDPHILIWLFRTQRPLLTAIFLLPLLSSLLPLPSSLSLFLRRFRRSLLLSSLLSLLLLLFLLWYTTSSTLIARHACVLYRDTQLVEQPVRLDNLTLRFTREALSFLSPPPSPSPLPPRPFFLFMSYVKVHTALFTSAAFRGASANHGEYGDNILEMDWSVGQIVEALRRNGQIDNTLIFFTSDNGPFLERGAKGGFQGYVRDSHGVSRRLKGGKGQTWEGGVRVPAIVHWPRVIPPEQVIDVPLSTLDFLPTILSAAGVTLPSDRFIDGVDFLPLLRRSVTPESHNRAPVPFYSCSQLSAVRRGDYKVTFSLSLSH